MQLSIALRPGATLPEEQRRGPIGVVDRTLEAAPRAIRAGVGFDFQVVASVPHGAGDQHMDLVVTDAGTRVRRPR